MFTYEKSCRLNKDEILAGTASLEPVIGTMRAARSQGYATVYASLTLVDDTASHTHIMDVARAKQALQPSLCVVIGVGGSNLGAYALYQALVAHGYHMTMPCYWADTIAPEYAYHILATVRMALQAGKKILLIIISKSGTTIETQAYAVCFIALLKQFYPHDFMQYVVVITDAGSCLHQEAQKHAYTFLEIPRNVGGRYSVMSAAGLFPLAMLGVDIHALIAGARGVRDDALKYGIASPIAESAAILALCYQRALSIHDLFIFDPALETLGKWYRQLLSESIGKEYSVTGQRVEIGFTATVSIGSIDLHSVVQRILAGPKNIFTTFLSVAHTDHDVHIPHDAVYYAGKKFSALFHAMLMGTQRAYLQYQCPFAWQVLDRIDVTVLGQWMQWKMIEIMYLGFLLKINPFDQPHVEAYKRETRKIIEHG